ncbi:hypothetical protein [Phenylobacterium sp.]|uniref:hypothetical protein n=1 Tax=Phenylobacterium sp. TaxID=1871053 RepID=UPI0035B3A206
MSKARLSTVFFGAVLAFSVMTNGSAATGRAAIASGGEPMAAATASDDGPAELASWAMMIVGFCGAGAMIRSRRRLQAWAA